MKTGFRLQGKGFRAYHSKIEHIEPAEPGGKGATALITATGKVYQVTDSGAVLNHQKVRGTKSEKKALKKHNRSVREIRQVNMAGMILDNMATVEGVQQGPL